MSGGARHLFTEGESKSFKKIKKSQRTAIERKKNNPFYTKNSDKYNKHKRSKPSPTDKKTRNNNLIKAREEAREDIYADLFSDPYNVGKFSINNANKHSNNQTKEQREVPQKDNYQTQEQREVPQKEYVDDEFSIRGMLQSTTRRYFEQTLALFEEHQEDKQELRMITEGVLSELRTQEIDVACKDSVAARVIEEMCRVAKKSQLLNLMTLFKPYVGKLIGHTTASYVVQKYVIAVAKVIHTKDNKLVQPFIEFLEELKGYWVSLILQPKASFVVRAIIRLLGDLPQTDKNEDSDHVPQPNEAFHIVLRGIVDELLAGAFGTIYNCCLSINAAPCITALVVALKGDAEYYKNLVFEVLGAPETDHQRLAMHAREITANTAAVRVIEALFNTCDDSIYGPFIIFIESVPLTGLETYNTLVTAFINKFFIKQAGESDGAKFILRAIQKNARDKSQVESLLDKLLDDMDVMLKSGDNNGLIPTVFDIGIQWPEFQDKILTRVLNVACPDGKDIFSTVLHLGKLNATPQTKKGETKPQEFPALGIQLLKQIWNFNYSAKQVVIQSAMKTDGEILAKLAMSHGRILEAMITDSNVPVSVARKILPRVASFVPKMAQDQYGSYFVEKMYEKVDLNTKMKVVGLLANIRDELRTTPNGRVLIVKTHLDQYVTNPKLWEKSMKKETTRLSFSEIANKTEFKEEGQEDKEEGEEESREAESEPPQKKQKKQKKQKTKKSTNDTPPATNDNDTSNPPSSKSKKKKSKHRDTEEATTQETAKPAPTNTTQTDEHTKTPTTTTTETVTPTSNSEDGKPKSNKKQASLSNNQAAFLANLKSDLSDKKRKRETVPTTPTDKTNANGAEKHHKKDKTK